MTEAVDDISGRNNCPLYKRITALQKAIPFRLGVNHDKPTDYTDLVSPPPLENYE